MLTQLIRALFGNKNQRELKRILKVIIKINVLEETLSSLSDQELAAKTAEFKARLEKGETLQQLLPDAFAVVREASKRVLGMRHFDVQLIGGMVLHEGKIAEMRTGEGKTLVATLPAYLNALTGKGVHVVTVNEYLAKRDAGWMSPIYEFLGLTVGVVVPGQTQQEKSKAYRADITYGTNNELGFDYLRDNMAFSLEDKMQRDLHYAVIDEVDSILIDEARTPLIISGPVEDSSKLYQLMNRIVPRLTQGEEPKVDKNGDRIESPGHYWVDEKQRQVELTEAGHEEVEKLLAQEGLLEAGDSLYAASHLNLLHHVHAALKAHVLFKRDVEYIVQNGQIVIVDEHTGRTMPGRRWSEGIHQAVEAKEGVRIQQESQTLASTTFQNYFRLYQKLSGMTGTADTEAFEFRQIYGLDVVVIPTNQPMIRQDNEDVVYLTMEEKFEAIVKDIEDAVNKGQPVLVGTVSIETSEYASGLLKKHSIKHQVLNAKFHAKEAEIVAQAGRPGAVTIATNMAGRGTDIVLGGNWEAEIAQLENPSAEQIAQVKADWQQRHAQVIVAGGLYIIGTERHESRRIDNQLRGRSGRQGDPGASRFYLSLEDNLMRIFASDRVKNLMKSLGMQRGEAIEHRWVTRAIENAQRKVESRNFDIRKSLLEYDNVANDQRQVIYAQRNELMQAEDISDIIKAMRQDVINSFVNQFIPPKSFEEQWDIAGLEKSLEAEFQLKLSIKQWLEEENTLHEENLRQRIYEELVRAYAQKEQSIDAAVMRKFEKQVMLSRLDHFWKEHLAMMDHLRQGIHLRGYSGKNPKQEYKREAFLLFQQLLDNIKYDVVKILSCVEVRRAEDVEAVERQRREALEREEKAMQFQHSAASALDQETPAAAPSQMPTKAPFVRQVPKVGRNDACPCGSGKKFKQCHGQLA